MNRRNVALFASGQGSNVQAIVDRVKSGSLEASLSLLVCDQPGAPVIERAQAAGIPLFAASPKEFASKEEYERAILERLEGACIDLVVLAGYMRLIGSTLLAAYRGRIINIHPSLLPSFPGRKALEEALAHGVKVIGVTVHYVDEGIDTGPIIAQEAFSIEGLDKSFIENKLHETEHRLYPEVIQKVLEEK